MVDKNIYLLDTNYFFSLKDIEIYILGILNAKLIKFWINLSDTPIGEGLVYRHYKYTLEKLPLIKTSLNINSKISFLLEHKKYIEIDKIVYKLYNITDAEIDYIENSENKN